MGAHAAKPRRPAWSPIDWYLMAALQAVYWPTHLYRILRFPIFNDECFHLLWARMINQDWAANKWISITTPGAGKQPLFMWLTAFVMKFVENELLAGRLVSVFTGAATLAGVYLVARELYDRRAAVTASVFYLFVPFMLFFDRMALMDSLLAACAIYVLYFSVRLAQGPGGRGKPAGVPVMVDQAGLGLALGLAVMTKANGLTLVLAPVLALTLLRPFRWRSFRMLVLPLMIAGACFGVLLMAPDGFRSMFMTTQIMTYPLAEIVRLPVGEWSSQAAKYLGWMRAYLGGPFIFLVLVLFATRLVKSRDRRDIYLAGVFSVLVAFFLVTVKVSVSRYIVFIIPWLLVLAGGLLGETVREGLGVLGSRPTGWRHTLGAWGGALALVVVLVLAPALVFDYHLWTDPSKAGFPDQGPYVHEADMYVQGDGAGFGYAEAFARLKAAAARVPEGQRLTVLGTPGWGESVEPVRIWLSLEPRINLVTYPGWYQVPASQGLAQMGDIPPGPVYTTLNQPTDEAKTFVRLNPGAKRVAKYWKPGRESWIEVLRIR